MFALCVQSCFPQKMPVAFSLRKPAAGKFLLFLRFQKIAKVRGQIFHPIDLKDSVQGTFRMFTIQIRHDLGELYSKKIQFPVLKIDKAS